MASDEEILYIPISKPKRPKYYLAALSAWFGSFAMGCVIGYSSPAIPSLQSKHSHLPITQDQSSWLGSLMALGAAFGGFCAGYTIDTFGRRNTLLFLSLPFVAGWLIMAYSVNVIMLLLGRTLTGFCTGIISLAAPVYIAETADPSARGTLGAGFQLSVALGVLFAYVLGSYVAWSWLAIYCAIFPILLLITMIFMPESPCWLIKHNRRSSAVEAFKYLKGINTGEAESECEALDDVPLLDADSDGQPSRTIYAEFLKPYNLKPFLVCLGVMFFQQVSGVNAVLFYTVDIFKSAGTNVPPNLAGIYVGIAQALATLASCFLTDRTGRRILLLFSGAVMCISLLLMGLYFFAVDYYHMQEIQRNYAWVPLATLISYVIATAVGYSPLGWLLLSELLPVNIRGPASGLATLFNWTCSFLVTREFYDMLNVFQAYGTYWFYSVICGLSCVFVIVFLPETKGRSLKEIEAHFRGESV